MSSTTAKVICCSRQEGPSKVQSERVRSSHRQTNGGQQAACDKDAESASAVVGDGRHLWFRSRVSGPPSRPLLPPPRARPSTRMARNSKNLMPVSSGFMSCRCIKIGGINRLRRGQAVTGRGRWRGCIAFAFVFDLEDTDRWKYERGLVSSRANGRSYHGSFHSVHALTPKSPRNEKALL